jgi:methylated-DNA-[protein]-cysteine S-methyltransferase
MGREREFDEVPLANDGADEAGLDELLRAAHRRFDRALQRIRRPRVEIGVAKTPLGELLIAQSARGLMLVRFLDTPDTPALMAELKERFDPVESPAMAAAIGGEIERLFQGETAAIAARPVDLSLVESAFQRRALTRLRKVPAGAVTTYQALAAASGSPSAQRAIGNTVASNPLAVYVPCHRVIKSDGALGNYGGGVERKLKLLRAEGFGFDREKRIPASTVYGHLVTRIFCRPTCAAAKRARIDRMLIFPDTRGAAAAGMRPCKLCHPA